VEVYFLTLTSLNMDERAWNKSHVLWCV